MILYAPQAHELCVDAFVNNGMPAHDARAIADVLVEAELWGKPTHGLCRVPGLTARYLKKQLAPPQVLTQGPTHLHIDAGAQFGYVVLHDVFEPASAKATESGLCIVGVRNSDHCGTAGYYAWQAADNGFIAALTCDCFPRTAPYGATSPVFGTNPIAFGIPTHGDPVVLDFSIAAMTNGLMNARKAQGKALPEGVGFDADGRPTTSPEECLAGAVKTFGGHKGSGIAIVAQIMCTAFVGATALPAPAADYGYFMMLVKPDLFVPLDEFKDNAQELLDAVKSARPEAGRNDVLLPGERSFAAKERALAEGIDVPDPIVSHVRQMAGEA